MTERFASETPAAHWNAATKHLYTDTRLDAEQSGGNAALPFCNRIVAVEEADTGIPRQDHENQPEQTMNTRNFSKLVTGAAVLAAWMLVPSAFAQRGRGPQGPQVVSPEVAADRRITFRILAAKAETVRLSGGDIPGNGQGSEMTKGTNGVWEVTRALHSAGSGA